jgi:hypothetical protein
MAYDNPSAGPTTFTLHYNTIKSLTSPEEKANGVQTWFANVSAREVVKLDTPDNLRTYIAEHKDSKRNSVHKEIEATILEQPDRFINRNAGVTITCTNCAIDDSKRQANLSNASIINGAQTQGELKRYFASLEEDDETDFPVRAEIIMEPQHEQIVEVAIARNTATSVKSVSQAGARGYLDDLCEAIEKGLPGETLQKRETDTAGLSAQAVLQWCRLLMPAHLEPSGTKVQHALQAGGQVPEGLRRVGAGSQDGSRSEEAVRFHGPDRRGCDQGIPLLGRPPFVEWPSSAREEQEPDGRQCAQGREACAAGP